MDFVILDMGCNKKNSLLLGRPFLNTTNAVLHTKLQQRKIVKQEWPMKNVQPISLGTEVPSSSKE
jgi:hypothetical protein